MVNKKDRLEIELVLKDLFSKPLKQFQKNVEGLGASAKKVQETLKAAATDLRSFSKAAKSSAAGLLSLHAAQKTLSQQVRGTAKSFQTFKKNLQESSAALRSMQRASGDLAASMELLKQVSQTIQAQQEQLNKSLTRQIASYNALAGAAKRAAMAKAEEAAAGAKSGAGRNLFGTPVQPSKSQFLGAALSAGAKAGPKISFGKSVEESIKKLQLLQSSLKGLSKEELKNFGAASALAAAKSKAFSEGIAGIVSKVNRLRSPLDHSTVAVQRFKARWKSMIESMKVGSQEVNRISFTFRRLFGILAAFAAARYAVAGFFGLIRESAKFNANLEQSRIGIATLFMATSDITDEFGNLLDESQKFPAALAEANKQIQQLRIDALKTTATFQQLVEAYQTAIAPGIQAGLNPDQIRKFSVRIAQAAQAIGLPMNQLAEEIRSTLAGTIQPRTTRIATALGIRNEDIRRAKEAGKLFEFLQKKFDAFAKTELLAANTMSGLVQRVKDFVQIASGEAGLNFFEQLKGYLKSIIASGLQIEGGVVKPSKEVVAAFKLVFEQLQLILRDLHDLSGGNFLKGFAQIIALLLQIGKLIGHYFVGGFKAVFFLLNTIATVMRPITLLVRATGIEFKYVVQFLGAIIIGQKIVIALSGRIKVLWGGIVMAFNSARDALEYLKTIKLAEIFTSAKEKLLEFKAASLAAAGQIKTAFLLAGAQVKKIWLFMKGLTAASLLKGAVKGFMLLGKGLRLVAIGAKIAFTAFGGLLGIFTAIVAVAYAINKALQYLLGTNVSVGKQFLYVWTLVKITFNRVVESIIIGALKLHAKVLWLLNKVGLVSDQTLRKANDLLKAHTEHWNKLPSIIAAANKAMNDYEASQNRANARQAKSGAKFKHRQEAVLSLQQRFNNELEISGNIFKQRILALQGKILMARGRESQIIEKQMRLERERASYEQEVLRKKWAYEIKQLKVKHALESEINETNRKWQSELDLLVSQHQYKLLEFHKKLQEAIMQETLAAQQLSFESDLAEQHYKNTAMLVQDQLKHHSRLVVISHQIKAALSEYDLKVEAINKKYDTLTQDVMDNLQNYDNTLEALRRLHELDEKRNAELLKEAATVGKIVALLKDERKGYSSIGGAIQKGLQNFVDKNKEVMKGISDLVTKTVDKLSDFIANSITDAFDPTKNKPIKERFAAFLQDLGRMLIQFAVKTAITKALIMAGATAWEGGPTEAAGRRSSARPSLAHAFAPGFAMGGPSTFARHPEDKIPIWVAPGEYILRRSAVAKYGLSVLNALNAGLVNPEVLAGFRSFRRFSSGPGFAEGGAIKSTVVPAAEPAKAVSEAQQDVVPAVIVANDEAMDRLLTGGKSAFLRFFREHSAKIKEALR